MDQNPINLDDFEVLARGCLPRASFDYFCGGAGDERSLVANRGAYDRWWLRPRSLVDVSTIDLRTTVVGRQMPSPIVIAPMAFHRLAHPEGELATARGAASRDCTFVLSTAASSSLEEVAATGPGPRWFQLYVYKDRALARHLVDRAEAAGFDALVLTVDTPHLGRRERDIRNLFTLPPGVELRNFTARPQLAMPTDASGRSAYKSFADYVHDQLDDSLTWEGVEWLRANARLPVIVKGILTAEDAALAVEHGCSGVIVSNHGGRQLDGSIPPIEALPEVVDAVAGRADVLVDGGVRRGTDVVKAIALGAKAVLVGRPILYALATSGEAGVVRALDLLSDELRLAMRLCGRTAIGQLDRSLLRRAT